jgi:hypothetical protein
MTARSQSTRPCLRLIPMEAPARRRLAVRISVLDGRQAFGRAGPFRLAENDLWKLVEIAMLMERAS